MALLKCIFILIIGDFIKNVMLFNPMLTYTIRYKKASVQPSSFGNLTIDQHRGTQLLNGHFTFPSTPITKVVAIFHRCDIDGINCEYFQTWTITDLCLKVKQENQVWSRWYGAIHPPLVCPFDKVHYRMINGTYDIGLVFALYPIVTDYHWRVIQKFYGDDDTYFSSVILEFIYFGYRKKIKLIPKL